MARLKQTKSARAARRRYRETPRRVRRRRYRQLKRKRRDCVPDKPWYYNSKRCQDYLRRSQAAKYGKLYSQYMVGKPKGVEAYSLKKLLSASPLKREQYLQQYLLDMKYAKMSTTQAGRMQLLYGGGTGGEGMSINNEFAGYPMNTEVPEPMGYKKVIRYDDYLPTADVAEAAGENNFSNFYPQLQKEGQ